MSIRIQVRRDTSEAWSLANPVLAAGEFGLDTTEGRVKVGDGVTPWAGLPWQGITGENVTGVWRGTQAAYDGLGTYDSATLYFIVG